MNIIFDLDGTLIDSSESILDSMRFAFKQCEVEPLQQFLPSLIGPPLYPTLKVLAGTDDPHVIDQLAASFMTHYDSSGYKQTVVFDDIDTMLNDLHGQGYSLYVLTNKRITPTLKIINYFSWDLIFKDLYALDQLSQTKNKTELIEHAVNINGLKKSETIYIGDTQADRVATHNNGLHYLMVTWGYGDSNVVDDDGVSKPELISKRVASLLNQ